MTGPRAGILFVGNFLSKSGSNQTYSEELSARVAARGWHVLTTSDRVGRASRLADMVMSAWSQRRRYSVAHVDVFSGSAFLWAEIVCSELHALRKPFMLTLRGGDLPRFAQRWPRRVARLLRAATRITSPSSYLKEALRGYASHIEVLPNALDVSRYPFVQRDRVRPRLVWLRALHDVYNPVLAVEVLAKVRMHHPDVRLSMIGVDKGDGSLGALKQRARDLGVEEHLAIIGGVPKMAVPEHLANADIFLNTTNVDNSPVSVVEAMACGLCVVSTNVGGLPHLLSDGVDSLLVPPRDASAMANAVERVLANAQLARAISEQARTRASQYDWSRVLGRWDRLFEGVLERA